MQIVVKFEVNISKVNIKNGFFKPLFPQISVSHKPPFLGKFKKLYSLLSEQNREKGIFVLKWLYRLWYW